MLAVNGIFAFALALTPGPAFHSRRPPARVGAVSMAAGGAGSWESDLREDMAFLQRDSKVQFGESALLLRKSDAHEAWVLLFNPSAPEEGIYTLQAQTTQRRTYLVGFACEDDAQRFGDMLEAEEFEHGAPACWSAEEIDRFCNVAKFELAFVPNNALLFPPTTNRYDEAAFTKMRRGARSETSDNKPDAYAAERILLQRILDSPAAPPAP